MKKSVLILLIFLFGAVSLSANNLPQLIEVPTAYTIGVKKGELLMWSNFNSLRVKGAYSPINDMDFMVSFKGQKNIFSGYATFKWQFVHDSSKNPAAALGIGNDAIYAVVSKKLNPGLTGHIGLGAGNLALVFAGLDYDLPVSKDAPKVKLVAEINKSLNFGAIASITPAFNIAMAIKNFNELNIGTEFKFAF